MTPRHKRGGAGRLGTEFLKRAVSGKMVDRTQTPKGRAKSVVTVDAGGLGKYFVNVGERL